MDDDSKKIWVILQRLEGQGKVIETLVRAVKGDGNGIKGLQMRVHDLENGVVDLKEEVRATLAFQSSIKRWAVGVGLGTISNLAVLVAVLLKYWVQTSGTVQ